ncbi:T9SS type A sorting domain-containing protein [Lewinella sp. LCG006]|uniref:T9SS type A sorting domain-containing protein n=1 Tax=Lewinella sp. LCG006 TaxID=3231911 RepID=UPI0034602414
MRLLLILVGFLSIGSLSLSAQHLCGTHPDSEGFELQKSRLLHNLRAAAEGTVTARDVSFVPIRFHVGAKNDGTGRISVNKVLDQLCELNEDFAPYDIQFFLAGGNINFINNTAFYENHSATQNSVMAIQKDPRALNVFIVESANTGNNPGDGVTLAYYSIPRDWIVITKTYIRDNDATLSHEIGHFFSLMHTFNGWECGGYNTEDVSAPTSPSCGSPATERANGSNCETSGDFICDTPPDYNNGLGWNNCNFTLNVLDPQGNVIDPDERNYMSYFLSCPDEDYYFSVQQNEAVQQDLNSFSRNYLRLDPVPNVPVITEGTTANYPINDEVTDAYNYVNFQWEAVPGATAYFLEIDRVATFSIDPIRLVVYGNSKVITELDPNRNYYWRVRPFNAMSGCAPISSLVSFRTGTGATNVETPAFVEEFTVSPNPVVGQSELQIRLSSQEAFNGMIEVLDITGRPTGVQRQYDFAAGAQQLSLGIDRLTNGIYLLQITTTEGRLTQKIVVAN